MSKQASSSDAFTLPVYLQTNPRHRRPAYEAEEEEEEGRKRHRSISPYRRAVKSG